MKDQLKSYVDLLFAGAPDAHDIKEEILQNTLDRYDDLIAQGKQPAAAYSLAIGGIGDLSEILGNQTTPQKTMPTHSASQEAVGTEKPLWKKILRAIGVFLYILCPVPLFVLDWIGMSELGLCGMLAIIAVATFLMVLSAGGKKAHNTATEKPENELTNAVKSIIFTIGLCVYLALSFATGAWYITWLIFPIIAAVQGLAKAIIDLTGGNSK